MVHQSMYMFQSIAPHHQQYQTVTNLGLLDDLISCLFLDLLRRCQGLVDSEMHAIGLVTFVEQLSF